MDEPEAGSLFVPRSFSGSTQLLGKALSALPGSRILILAPAEPELPRLLAGRYREAAILHLDYSVYSRDRKLPIPDGVALLFAPRIPHGTGWPLAAIYFPKEKELAQDLLTQAAAVVDPGGCVLAVGPNHGGIRSAAPLLEATVGPVTGSLAGRHCVLLTAARDDTGALAPEPRRFEVSALGCTLQVVSLPGVFSHGRLDPGTAMLLEGMGPPVFERALDLGCGTGVVGAALLAAHPGGRVDCADSFAPALDATRETLRANGLEGRVFPTDGFSEVRDSYDLILLNPPFHAGLRTRREAAHPMLEDAADHLTPDGRFLVVTNAFLDTLTPLRRRFRSVQVLVENRRYRVFEARDPRPREA